MYRPYSTLGLDTIISGARIIAAGHDLDLATMEGLFRKSARVGHEAMMQDARRATANDDAMGIVR